MLKNDEYNYLIIKQNTQNTKLILILSRNTWSCSQIDDRTRHTITNNTFYWDYHLITNILLIIISLLFNLNNNGLTFGVKEAIR